MERREAQGPSHKGLARLTSARRVVRTTTCQRAASTPPWRLPALHFLFRKRKKGTPAPPRRKQQGRQRLPEFFREGLRVRAFSSDNKKSGVAITARLVSPMLSRERRPVSVQARRQNLQAGRAECDRKCRLEPSAQSNIVRHHRAVRKNQRVAVKDGQVLNADGTDDDRERPE